MILTSNVASITISLSDVLMFNVIICLTVLTIYIVLTLKSLNILINQSKELVEESKVVVEDIQAKSKVVDGFVQEVTSSGQVLFKLLSTFKQKK